MSVKDPNLIHHKRYEYCRTRPKYRQGKNLSAIKVYTVINESKHILVFGVPKINLHTEIKNKLTKIGPLESINCITDIIVKQMELEQFTDCFHAVFKKLQDSRKAKKFFDAREFYGGILHITYGPEYENVDDIRKKLNQRKSEVRFRVTLNKNHIESTKTDNVDEPTSKQLKIF